MPFKSQAQRRKFYEMARRGEISWDTVHEWEQHTPKDEKLPERLHKKASMNPYELGRQDALKTAGIHPAVWHAAAGLVPGALTGYLASDDGNKGWGTLGGAVLGAGAGAGIGAGVRSWKQSGAVVKALNPHVDSGKLPISRYAEAARSTYDKLPLYAHPDEWAKTLQNHDFSPYFNK